MKHEMKFYRLTVTFVILIAFAGQMLHGTGLWSYTLQGVGWNTTEFCANKEMQNNLVINQDLTQTSDGSCTTIFNPIFVLKQFTWEPTVVNKHKEAIISFQNIQEQVFVDKLLDPPQA